MNYTDVILRSMTPKQGTLLPPPQEAKRPSGPKRLGAVYTPYFLARWVAGELMELVESQGTVPRILDPACGDGSLLQAVHEVSGCTLQLVGMDLREGAIAGSRENLGPDPLLHVADSLTVDLDNLLPEKPDALIANPPWGADLAHSANALRGMGYELAKGQFDSYELFVERFVRWLDDDTPMALILPDSIFLPEHQPLRSLLASSTRLMMMARLGEGFFEGVYRGTCILTLRVGRSKHRHRTRCFSLPPDVRKAVLAKDVSLAEVAGRLEHLVPQSRFAGDGSPFDIDIRVREQPILRRFEGRTIPWSDWLDVGRGVELGKRGEVLVCRRCGSARPRPRTENGRLACARCGDRLHPKNWAEDCIIRELKRHKNSEGWKSLIVGEDVKRYAVAPSRTILLGVPGIDYKDPGLYRQRKLLVRKTGIGIHAAIDTEGAHTLQVVYHMIQRSSAPAFLLDYLLGILCSRVLLAVYLRRSGEDKWRSHPYVTPRVLSSLPLLDPRPEGSPRWKQAVAIAEAVRARSPEVGPDHESDLKIDRLVAGLYDMDSASCAWVASVLDRAQNLSAIAPLRVRPIESLAPIRVE